MDWWRESEAKHAQSTAAIISTPQRMRHLDLFVFVEAIFEPPLNVGILNKYSSVLKRNKSALSGKILERYMYT